MRKAVTCEQIWEEPLRAVPFDEMTEESFVELISVGYSLERQQVEQYARDGSAVGNFDSGVGWQIDERYYAGLFNNHKLYSVVVTYSRPNFTLAEVLSCLGPPSNYAAISHTLAERPRTTFHLWYPDDGVIVTFQSAAREPVVSSDMRATRFTITRPDEELREMLRVDNGWAIEVQDFIFGVVRPWPGNLEDIEIVHR